MGDAAAAIAGVLGRYALKGRAHRTRTAMEPELAFLMANLARVRAASPTLPHRACTHAVRGSSAPYPSCSTSS